MTKVSENHESNNANTLLCTGCGSEYILRDTKEIDFDEAQIPPEKSGYDGTMAYHMKISISWCMECGKLLSSTCA